MKFSTKIPKTKSIMMYGVYCVIVSAVLLFFARNFDWFGEFYASRIFPIFPNTIGRFMSIFPFAVFEIFIYIFAIAFLAFVVYFVVLMVLPSYKEVRRENAKTLGTKAACVIVPLVCTGLLMFTLAAGINYSRDTFGELTNRHISPSSPAELLALAEILIENLEELSQEIPLDERRRFTIRYIDVNAEARAAMKQLGEEIPVLAGFYPNAKPVIASRILSRFNTAGIFIPFTMEATFNHDIPDHQLPFVIAHEFAHFRGFMREDEANFIAYLACRGSESIELRYSGAINALVHVLNAYARVATPQEYADLLQKIPDQVLRDFAVGHEYWAQFRGRAAQISTRVNDAYLRANAQTDGVYSYGRMVDLLLAEYL